MLLPRQGELKVGGKHPAGSDSAASLGTDDDIADDCLGCCGFGPDCCETDQRCCSIDLCGLVCCAISWFTLVFCSFTLLTSLNDLPLAVRVVYAFSVLCAMVAHLQATLREPGFVDKGTGVSEWAANEQRVRSLNRERFEERRQEIIEHNREVDKALAAGGERDPSLRKRVVLSDAEIVRRCHSAVEKYRRKVRYCRVCECFKPESAHHCSVCQRCVERMDHHCPWINNCVGESNLRYFLLFLFWVFVASSSTLLIFAYRGYSKYMEGVPLRRLGGSEIGPWTIISFIVTIILCLFFCIFVVAMSCEQYEAVTSGVPGIDSRQGKEDDEELSLYQGLKKYACNHRGFSPMWFIPVPLAHVDAKLDKLE
mmetsp:Transcript_17145/g.43481  ORF Transcript_17145/g.43481 Transcript_17145/m.43481 type:complete len:368 (+) Transcript_17145:58-1161(+)